MSFNPKKIAIALITYYPKWYSGKLRSLKHTDKVRGDLAIQTIEKAIKSGYQTIVEDGKSAKTFYRSLQKIPNIILGKRRSVKASPAKRQAIKKASRLPEVEVIVLMEPEKLTLLEFLPKAAKPILEGKVDIVIPKREDKLFKNSYPDFQYESELEGNRVYNEELRSHELLAADAEDLDLFFGPRVFRNSQKVRSLFTKKYHFNLSNIAFPAEYFDPEAISNVLFFPVVRALQKKIKVCGIEIPFKYPEIQKNSEERGSRRFFLEKRKTQYLSLTVELLHFVGFLEKYKGSRIKKIQN